MKVAILYPPFRKGKQYAQLPQNRQFRYMYTQEARIYPMVMSVAATLLHQNSHDVLFLDGINNKSIRHNFMNRVHAFNPDVIIFETKAPVVKKHWKMIDEIKKRKDIVCVLVGDHISAFPEESMKNSRVDFCLTGGDYDLSILMLVEFLSKKRKTLPKGCYYRHGKRIKNTGSFELVENLDSLPFIDRDLTKWRNYGEAYLYQPCTYILTGRGCGGTGTVAGRCTFCSWQHAFWKCTARLRSPKNVVEEISILVRKYKVKEIFDDNEGGAMWNKEWLKEFYNEMKKHNLIGKVVISSNARADSLDKETCNLLSRTGYRLLKIGLETGNDKTLKMLNKLETIDDIKRGVKNAKDKGLIVMLTTMVGYPWESQNDFEKTYEVAKELMLYKTHFGDVLQSSIVVPYPGLPLYEQALKNKWFVHKPKDYEKYDMDHQILKSPIDTDAACKRMWKIHYEPRFVIRSILTLKSFRDIKLALRGMKSLIGHVQDYRE
ncbi:radical SAM protein [Candidatus Woesearchaeota archaeon]|nr:radical SAM protein [Candidatus Woesearchaeota archaeon]